jgi:hypothetical protein
VDESKEDVLGADVIVVEHACFFLSQDNYTSGSIGKALKHRLTSSLLLLR